MKTDIQLQKDVMDELAWEPVLNASEIGVSVKNGVVTLSGLVDSYYKKLTAEKATKRVAGVKAIAEDIRVGTSVGYNKTDTEIAEAVVNALKWHPAVQEDKIKVKVEGGNVKLEGEVEWEYQRINAKNAVQYLSGVRSVVNLITLKPKVTPLEIRQKISTAFHRHATVDADKITIEVKDGNVTLRGTVSSFAEKEDAENAAWNAPGVTSINNKLTIDAPEYEFEEE